jgi:hypothetical protein
MLNFDANTKCHQLKTYHRLRWLGKVCRMNHDRLPVRTLFGRISGHGPRGRPHTTWIEFTRDDLTRLSELQGVDGTYIELVGTVQIQESLDNRYSRGLNKHTKHAERGQFRLEYMKCEVSSV